jgi:hypothetical protein
MTTKSKFLADGAASYLDALVAIQAFQKEVRSICRSVYRCKQSDLSKAGIVDGECRDFTYPEPGDEIDEPIVQLGVQQRTTTGGRTFYVYLNWDGTEAGAPKIRAEVSLGFDEEADRERCAKRLQDVPAIRCRDDAHYSLYSTSDVTDLSMCAKTLDALLEEWIKHWPSGAKSQ